MRKIIDPQGLSSEWRFELDRKKIGIKFDLDEQKDIVTLDKVNFSKIPRREGAVILGENNSSR